MTVMTLETVLRRERVIIALALAAVALLAWSYILVMIWQADHGASLIAPSLHGPSLADARREIGAVDVPQLAMSGMALLATPRFADLPVLVLMWSVTMIGIMTPSAAPAILLYARVARQSAAKGHRFAAASWFAGGYLLAWLCLSILLSVAQIWLQRQTLLAPTADSTSRLFAGFLLLAAGLFQWGSLKDACLSDTRRSANFAPLDFIQHHGGFKPEPHQSLRLGFLHGSYCVACCWALIALLFVGGIMNILWIAALSILVLLEKMMPLGRDVARLASLLLLAGGGWVLLSELT